MEITKKELRKAMLLERSGQSEAFRTEAGLQALKRLLTLDYYQNAESVMIYIDIKNELPTGAMIHAMLNAGKAVVLPSLDGNCRIIPCILKSLDDLVSGYAGIPEPDPQKCGAIDPAAIDLVLVPGVAFDRQGNRLGYGKGCYDEFLPKLREQTPKIGMAYDFQVLDAIPAVEGDFQLDGILTPSAFIRCRP